MASPRARLGAQGESIAAAHLEASGLKIMARNFRTRYGEIDLIAEDGDTLVFVEVKTRRGGSLRHAGGGRDRAQTAAPGDGRNIYLQEHSQEQREWRIDVVGIALQRNGRAVTNYVRGIDVE